MKIVAAMILAGFLSFTTYAQEWTTDFAVAQKQARATGHNIVLVFAGSDWCTPCIKLEREIWNTEDFQALAQDHFIMLKADFPRKKQNRLSKEQQEKNNKLAEAYNKNGNFPFVLVLNDQGQVLGKTGYKKTSPQAYFKHLTSFEN